MIIELSLIPIAVNLLSQNDDVSLLEAQVPAGNIIVSIHIQNFTTSRVAVGHNLASWKATDSSKLCREMTESSSEILRSFGGSSSSPIYQVTTSSTPINNTVSYKLAAMAFKNITYPASFLS